MNKAIPITQRCKSPAKQTKADSTFIRKNHPVYTGGYMMKTFKEMDERPRTLIARTRQMESDHAQANKIREIEAINRAKKTGIDVPKMKAFDGSAKAGKKVKKAVSPIKKISPACKTAAKKKFDVWPSAYASGWGVRCTKAGGPGKMGKKSPAKQTKPKLTDKLYEKAEKLQSKADNAASKGKNKKAARLENRVARVEKRENKKRKKYNY